MPEYVALSYTWGSPSPTYRILINDTPYMVRENLFRFLCAYRKDPRCDTHPFLWIDQICIDQENTNERNHQVRLMKSVYSRAHLVVSWLDDSSYDAICTFHRGGTPDLLQSAVTDILSNVYFTRLWVVQEFLLANTLVIFCRDVWIEREAITRILNRDIYRVDYTGSSKEALFRRSSYRPSGDIELSFLTCLLHWASMDCESIRDKVYGFLRLIPHKFTDIDYDKPVQEVYLDALRYVLEDQDRTRAINFPMTSLDALSQLAVHMHLFDIADATFVRFLEDVSRVVNVVLEPRHFQALDTGFRWTQNEKPNQWWYTFGWRTYSYDW
ncbi:hypothetical protein J1614_008616 [Plenodomus biglobosus]|nr:hypothetical protein J1614_008616 [Plenodomus biglobosus]